MLTVDGKVDEEIKGELGLMLQKSRLRRRESLVWQRWMRLLNCHVLST